MQWIETENVPEKCRRCEEEDCYNCDYLGGRWQISAVDELILRRKSLLMAIERQRRKIADIEKQLQEVYGIVITD